MSNMLKWMKIGVKTACCVELVVANTTVSTETIATHQESAKKSLPKSLQATNTLLKNVLNN